MTLPTALPERSAIRTIFPVATLLNSVRQKSANSAGVELAIKPTELLVETASARSAVRSARSGAVNSSGELICRIEISEVFGDISSF